MSQLEDTKIALDERVNPKIKTPKGRKDSKMSNKDELQTLPPMVMRGKKYQKSRGEHFKDVVIAILITAIIAFVAGANYASKQQSKVDQVRAEAQSSVEVQPTVKK